MATKISMGQLAKFKGKAESLMKRAQAAKGKTEKVVDNIVRTAEVAASAFAMGAVQGRFGNVEVAGVPADLGGALLLHGIAFTGMAGKASHHVHALADGVLASYATNLGKGVGVGMKEKALGGRSSVKGARLTDKELRELAGKGEQVSGEEAEVEEGRV